MLIRTGLVTTLFLLPFICFGKVTQVSLKLDDDLSSHIKDYYDFNKGEKPPKSSQLKRLYDIKYALAHEGYKKCVNESSKWLSSQSKLKAWVFSQKIECLQKLISEKSMARQLDQDLTGLSRSVDLVGGDPGSQKLQKSYVEASLDLLDHYLKKNRTRAWALIERLEPQISWLDDTQQSDFYKMAGDLSFSQQDLKSAKTYYLRSLFVEDSVLLRRKLEAISKQLGLKEAFSKEPVVTTSPIEDAPLISSDEESELFKKMLLALEKGAYLGVVEDGLELMSKFPSSERTKRAAKEVGSILRTISYSGSPKSLLLKAKLFKAVKEANGEFLLDWSESLFEKSYYEEAIELAEAAMEKLEKSKNYYKVFEVIGMSHFYLGQYEKGRDSLEKLVQQSVGQPEAVSGLFYLGLLNFRLANFSKSTFYFERVLALHETYSYELSSMYWLWRAYVNQKLESKVKEVGERLIQKYPSSYFAMRVHIDRLQKESTDYKEGFKKLKLVADAKAPMVIKADFTNTEKQAWENFNLLKEGGWYLEAREELKQLPAPENSQQKLLYAQFWNEVKGFNQSFIWLSEAWGDDISLLNSNTIYLSFPRLYIKSIEKWSKVHNLEPEAIMALIKQESSFMSEARSPANALGLMQLVRVTAFETAKKVGFKKFNFFQDMQDPDTNIRFGTHYLNRMIRVNKGHFGLALAYYNAGIGNVYKWLSQRKELLDLRENLEDSPDKDIWIEELPWSETRYYVKAVLRNYLVYRLLSEKALPQGPVWDPYRPSAQ